MKTLDKYILKKYFVSLFFTLLILLPIAVAIDVSDKVDNFLKNTDLTLDEIINDYYVNFMINYGISFLPLALFISVIMFTSKISNDSEIIAIHSSGISFKRFLQPYFIGAFVVAIFSFYANHFIVPKSNKVFEKFSETYLRSASKKVTKSSVTNVSLQLSDNDYVYFGNYNYISNQGYNFSYEHFEGNQLKYKLRGNSIKWVKEDSIYKIRNYKKRYIYQKNDSIDSGNKLDTTFNFFPKDLLYVDYLSKEMSSIDLYHHIKQSEKRGVKNLNNYKVELYKRTSLPISAFILTIIAVTLSSRKRRGGIGVNLAAGVTLMFTYVFFLKVSEVLGSTANANPLLTVWIPNAIFGALAVFLYLNHAKR